MRETGIRGARQPSPATMQEIKMPERQTKSRQPLRSKLREAAYIFTFPALMLIWAVQSYV